MKGPTVSVTGASQLPAFNVPGPLNSILNDVSWPLKIKLLNEYNTKSTQTPQPRRVGIQAYRMSKGLRDDEELAHPESDIDSHHHPISTTEKTDDNNMKMKLFRLMYETIRDSDLKVKRAEVIKKYYTNITTFNLGYLIGEITQRFQVMTDIANTLKKMSSQWAPMEHINAYELIANKAIEVYNLIDTAKVIYKQDANKTILYRHH